MTPDDLRDLRKMLHQEVGRVVVGQSRPLDLCVIALLCHGHVLLHGVPGTAKTLLARTFAGCLALDFQRIQFTPDLMPGDVLGTNLFNFETNQFALTKGPIFTEVLLADEINRTPPKTQAALLQAMQERTVTIDGTTHALGDGFMVIATQNPIEHEGTYPLPEAQLDRFLFKVDVSYPSRDEELEVVRRHGRGSGMPDLAQHGLKPIATLETLRAARACVEAFHLSDEIVAYVVDLLRATREHPAVACGASPRAGTMLSAAARALAALEGRDFVIPDDVKRLAQPCLAHRIVLTPGADIEGQDPRRVVGQVVDQVPAPR